MTSKHVLLVAATLVAVVGVQGGQARSEPRDQAKGPKSLEQLEDALRYANTHPVVLKGAGSVVRNADGTWKLTVEQIKQPISIDPIRGRTDFPTESPLSGTVLIGAHGPFVAFIVDTAAGESLSAVMELGRDQLEAVMGPDSGLQSVAKPTSMQEVAALRIATVRLVKVFHDPSTMAPFGMFASSESTNTGVATAAAGSSCSCFLACSTTCGEGELAECECQFLGRNVCKCVSAQ